MVSANCAMTALPVPSSSTRWNITSASKNARRLPSSREVRINSAISLIWAACSGLMRSAARRAAACSIPRRSSSSCCICCTYSGPCPRHLTTCGFSRSQLEAGSTRVPTCGRASTSPIELRVRMLSRTTDRETPRRSQSWSAKTMLPTGRSPSMISWPRTSTTWAYSPDPIRERDFIAAPSAVVCVDTRLPLLGLELVLAISRRLFIGDSRHLGGEFASAYIDERTGDVTRLVGGEETDQVGDVLLGAPFAQRQGVEQAVLLRRRQLVEVVERGGDHSGRVSVHCDIPRADLAGQRAGEVGDGGFRRGISGAPNARNDGSEGCRVDDPTAALGLHGRQHGLAHEEGSLEIHVVREVPNLLRQGGDVTVACDSGIVNQQVDATELRHHFLDDGADARAVAHITEELAALMTRGCQLRRDRVEIALVDVQRNGGHAFAGEGHHQLSSNAFTNTSDNGDAAA